MAVLLHLAADMVWHFEVRIALVMWRESIMVELKTQKMRQSPQAYYVASTRRPNMYLLQ